MINPHIHRLPTPADIGCIDNNHPLFGYPFVFCQQVAWGDMDAFNHLNNVKYYEYSQSARIAFMQRFDLFDDDGYTVIVSTACDFLASVYFGDILSIGVRVARVGTTSLKHEYTFYSHHNKQQVAKGYAVMVQLDKQTHHKKAWSDKQIHALQQLS